MMQKTACLACLLRATVVSLAMGALTACALVSPQTRFTPPQHIVHEGITYTLAFQQAAPNAQVLSEYTHNGESVENWSTLITLNYFPGQLVTPRQLLQSLKQTLETEQPVPHFLLTILGEHGYTRTIREPTATHPWFEMDVHKSFHRRACAGLVVYQYAVKYPPPGPGEDKQALLEKIRDENQQVADAMKQSDWQPDCS